MLWILASFKNEATLYSSTDFQVACIQANKTVLLNNKTVDREEAAKVQMHAPA